MFLSQGKVRPRLEGRNAVHGGLFPVGSAALTPITAPWTVLSHKQQNNQALGHHLLATLQLTLPFSDHVIGPSTSP